MNKSVSKLELLIVLAICLFLCLVGCAGLTHYGKLEKNARQNYADENYDQAVYSCANSLRINPRYEKSQELIQVAFTAAISLHENKIKELEFSSAKFKWDEIVFHYNSLVKLNQTVAALPKLKAKKTNREIKFDLKNYTSELVESRKNAAEEHYQEGIRLSNDGNVDVQRSAAKEFKTAEMFVPGYKDAGSQYLKSHRAALKRIAIIPFENKSGKDWYGALSELITDEITSDIMNDSSVMEFLEIVSRDQLEEIMREQDLGLSGIIDEQTAVELGKVLSVHEIVTGQITQIISAPERTTRSKGKQTARVVIGTEKYKDGEGKTRERNVYGDVHADVTYYTKAASASISGSYRIIDVRTAEVKKSQSITGKYEFKHKYARFSGDERALSSDAHTLVLKDEGLAPVDEEMVNYAAKDLSALLANTLKQYAK
ncbi:MAG TPA: CsgG/HfaB family protein [candidate division Zixibacteria bacterium]